MYQLGIVDFDSSHCVEFTRRFNHVGMDSDQTVEGARVVLGCPGNSFMSPERIPIFTPQVIDCGVELVEHPEEMIGRIDAVLILSICGSVHLERVTPFLKAGIPAFVDKPFACTLSDAQAMFELARQQDVSLWSSSGMRFATEVLEFPTHEQTYGRLCGVLSHGAAKRAPGNPGLLHYGIHAIEILCTLMGPGCQAVTTVHSAGADVVTGEWADGRLGTLRGQRHGSTAYGFTAFCERGIIPQAVSSRYSYRNLCQNIVNTLRSGVPPVTALQTLEVLDFGLAALRSEQSGGQRMVLETANATSRS
ncbi:MAG: Oxidoreductase [Planctomycetaceae bacterium]|nr:Oxidoreductase [Planctomycetaceae bacterium]